MRVPDVVVIQVDRRNACLRQRGEFAALRDTIRIGIYPDLQIVKLRIRRRNLVVVIAVELFELRKSIKDTVDRLVAEQFAVIVNRAVAVAVERQEPVLRPDPAHLLAEAVAVDVPVDRPGAARIRIDYSLRPQIQHQRIAQAAASCLVARAERSLHIRPHRRRGLLRQRKTQHRRLRPRRVDHVLDAGRYGIDLTGRTILRAQHHLPARTRHALIRIRRHARRDPDRVRAEILRLLHDVRARRRAPVHIIYVAARAALERDLAVAAAEFIRSRRPAHDLDVCERVAVRTNHRRTVPSLRRPRCAAHDNIHPKAGRQRRIIRRVLPQTAVQNVAFNAAVKNIATRATRQPVSPTAADQDNAVLFVIGDVADA